MKHFFARNSFVVSLGGLIVLSALFASVPSVAQEVIVDDTSPDTVRQGSWFTSAGQNPFMGRSLYSNQGSRFTWPVSVPEPGDYDVYAWWTFRPNRSNNVPYTIDTGVPNPRVDVNVDQLDPNLGGQWNLLGRFSLDARVSITVSSINGQASADAVRIVRVAGMEISGSPCFDNVNRYVDCGDGTVTDSVTGLIWTRDAGCIESQDFASANNAAAALQDGMCGLSDGSRPGDWRIPTQAEWSATIDQAVQLGCTSANGIDISLTDVTGTACFNAGDPPFVNVDAAGTALYWTGSAVPGDPQSAFTWLTSGSVTGSTPKQNLVQAWVVRK